MNTKETMAMVVFEKELTELVNKHSIENILDMPDFLVADMVCRILKGIGPTIKANTAWHTNGPEIKQEEHEEPFGTTHWAGTWKGYPAIVLTYYGGADMFFFRDNRWQKERFSSLAACRRATGVVC